MSLPKKRICIIGAGPGGMTALYQLKLLVGDSIDVKCYEKQSIWGGMWNYSWRTGKHYGEQINTMENM
jgi:trimethylamine monooxygenase